MTNKEIFLDQLLRVEREGISELVQWLGDSDFFTAPCSTRYHLACEGGLVLHSIHVYEALIRQDEGGKFDLPMDSIRICGLLHDICKANFYTQEMRNVKENGVWVQKPYYTVKDQFPYGHGEKSALLVNRFIKLKPAEHMAIRWHMGGFTPGIQDYSLSQAMSEAFKNYPLAVLLHMADMESTYLIEKEEVNE